MDGDKSIESSQIDAQAAGTVLSASRRRLLRSGLGASPVLLTFASQSVSAAVCKSASATVSANASRANIVATCNAANNGVSYWLANQGSWPSGVAALAFQPFFGSPYPFSGATATTNMLQVLQGTTTPTLDKLARNMVVALINSRKGLIGTGAYDEPTLKIIWQQATSASGYKPIAGGTAWYAQDVLNWLWTMFLST
jgi:hypothetical protein